MGRRILSKAKVIEIAEGYYERNSDREWLKRVHQMSHQTLWNRMNEYNIKTKLIVVIE